MNVETKSFSISFEEIGKVVSSQYFLQRMRPYVEQAADVIKGEVRIRFPVSSGKGRNSIFRKIETSDRAIEATVYVPEGLPAAQYAYFVEHKRRPGKMPPFGRDSNLYQWVKRKLSSAHFAKTGKRKKDKSFDKQVANVTYLIARWIGAHGTFANPKFPAPHPFEEGFKAANPQAQKILERGYAKIASELFK